MAQLLLEINKMTTNTSNLNNRSSYKIQSESYGSLSNIIIRVAKAHKFQFALFNILLSRKKKHV